MRPALAPPYRVLLAALLATAACRSTKPPPKPSAAASASASAQPRPNAPRPPAPPLVSAPVGCRVLAVKSPQPPPADTPRVGRLYAGALWEDFAAGVEVSLKHGETTRELTLLGPGRFVVCPRGEESVVVARGKVRTTPGAGSRAGALVSLATPFGVVQYADADLELEVGDSGLVLDVKQGTATVAASVTEDRRGGAPPKPVRGPRGKLELAGHADAAALVTRCEEAQTTSEAAKPAPSSRPERGKWAVQRLAARQAARLLCLRARAAIGQLEGPERDRLDDQVRDRKSLPRVTAGAPKEPETDAGK